MYLCVFLYYFGLGNYNLKCYSLLWPLNNQWYLGFKYLLFEKLLPLNGSFAQLPRKWENYFQYNELFQLVGCDEGPSQDTGYQTASLHATNFSLYTQDLTNTNTNTNTVLPHPSHPEPHTSLGDPILPTATSGMDRKQSVFSMTRDKDAGYWRMHYVAFILCSSEQLILINIELKSNRAYIWDTLSYIVTWEKDEDYWCTVWYGFSLTYYCRYVLC